MITIFFIRLLISAVISSRKIIPVMRKYTLDLSNFFFFFWGCLLLALRLPFSKRNRKTDIQQGIKAFFRRLSNHYGYCQEIIPNTLILKKAAVIKGEGSGCCQRWQVCFEASSVLFLMWHSCTSPILCHKGANIRELLNSFTIISLEEKNTLVRYKFGNFFRQKSWTC